MSDRLKGNVAIVTGAAKGIGRAIAERLARDGANLVLADIDGSELKNSTEKLQARGIQVVSLVGDLSEQNVAKDTVELAVDQFGRLDILINNAGGGIIKAFAEHTPETLKTTIDRNLWTVGAPGTPCRECAEMATAGSSISAPIPCATVCGITLPITPPKVAFMT